ncbi:MAG: undecaprenyldiphospho-muramoylpentapeptide beta-N-acetylglucosaminyltransferase, partial [Pyrinomonadaceae bacterium]
AGAAKMILQSDLSGEMLAGEIKNVLLDPKSLKAAGEAARKLGRRDAAGAAVDLIEELAKGKNV